MEQLLLAVLILVHLFFLPFASPRTGTLGGEREEKDWGESLLQLTIEEGGDHGGGFDAIEGGKNGIGHRRNGSGLFMTGPLLGSDFIRGSAHSIPRAQRQSALLN